MKIGSLIKYYRTKAKITQSKLSEGICSVSHLSKIENNNKEANKETIRLILSRLNINFSEVKQIDNQIKNLLDRLLEEIEYCQRDDAIATFNEISRQEEFITFTPFLYLNELIKFRYYLFIYDLKKAKEQNSWLFKQRINFSQYEKYLFKYYNAIYLILEKKYIQADDIFSQLLSDNRMMSMIDADAYYHISLVKGYLEQTGTAISYCRKSLQLYMSQYNLKRILHNLMLLGINYTHAGIYEEAINCYNHLIRNAELFNESELLPQIYNNIGYLLGKMGKYKESIYYYKKGLELHPNNSMDYIITLYSLSKTQYKLDLRDNSKENFEHVWNLAKSLNIQKYQKLSKYYLLKLADKQEESHKLLEKNIIPYLENSCEHKEEVKEFTTVLANHYKEVGNFQKAIKYLSY